MIIFPACRVAGWAQHETHTPTEDQTMMTTSKTGPDEATRRKDGAPGEGSAPNKEVGPALPLSAQGSAGDLQPCACPTIQELLDGLSNFWIRVTEKLPESGVSVLMCRAGDMDSIKIGTCDWQCGGWWDVYGEELDEPTHWAHLPEVPLEEVAP
jgi:hypothetical protein